MTDSTNPISPKGSVMTGLHVRHAGEEVVRRFLHLLETECESYCILGGYETLPMQVNSDIDFMVSRADFMRLPRLIDSFAVSCGFRVINAVDHEISARCYILAKVEEDACVCLYLDSASDYRRRGRVWLKAQEVLRRRRLHPRGFWFPAPVDGFIYSLVKRIERCDLAEKHCAFLSATFIEDPQGCREAVRKHWSAASTERICEAARLNDWSAVTSSIAALSTEMLAVTKRDGLWTRLKEVLHKCHRLIFRTGCWVAAVGPGGSGKSFLIATLTDRCNSAFRRVSTYSLRPTRGVAASPNVSVAGERSTQRASPSSASHMRLWRLFMDYVVGYWLIVHPQMVRTSLVTFDRYYPDVQADSMRLNSHRFRRMADLIERLIPLPDLIFVLDAPTETLRARQRDMSFEESTRQRNAYKKLAFVLGKRTRTVSIDTSRPSEVCVQEAMNEILRFLELRTRRRCRIAE